jgi:hypothetical protein
MTLVEQLKLQNISNRVLAGEAISPKEKQWCLDLAAREQTPIKSVLMQQAKKEGFYVQDINVIA